MSQVAIALRYLAGGSYLDVAAFHGVHRTTFRKAVWRVVEALNDSAIGAFRWPSSEEACATLSSSWAAKSDWQVFSHVVGAIDGLHVTIRLPTKQDDRRQIRYHSGHKGTTGLNLQAVCDSELRFIGELCCLFLGLSICSTHFHH